MTSCLLNVSRNPTPICLVTRLTLVDGFYLDENESETLYLDDIVLKEFSLPLQEELDFEQYYGYVCRHQCFFVFGHCDPGQSRPWLTHVLSNYQVTATGVCYRTEIAACLKYMPLKDWRQYILGYSTDGADEKKSEAIIQGWIEKYLQEVDTTVTALEKVGASRTDPKTLEKIKMLLKRWAQIRNLCAKASEVVSC
jgi:hypothetical protein